MAHDLPNTKDVQSADEHPLRPVVPQGTGTFAPHMSKESGSSGALEVPLHPIGTEVELPKEVQGAGVTSRTQTVELPPPIRSAGVRSVASDEPTQLRRVPALLTDQETIAGLRKKPETSWRWLAEFHKRQLLKIGIFLRTIHGTIQRVRKGQHS